MFFISSSERQYLFQQQSGQFRVCVLQRVQLLDQIVSVSWLKTVEDRVRHKHTLFKVIDTHSSLSPCVDLQCGLQYLSSLLGGAGQLLRAEEVACSTHLQHCDHGWVCVQPRSQLRTRRARKH